MSISALDIVQIDRWLVQQRDQSSNNVDTCDEVHRKFRATTTGTESRDYRMMEVVNGAYLITSAIAALAGFSAREQTRAWWSALAALVLGLGLARITQAGLWLDDPLQNGLRTLGWYGHRRSLQLVGLGTFACGLLLALRLARTTFKGPPLTTAICASYSIVLFAAIRLSSFHWTDEMMGRSWGPVPLSQALQLILLGVVSVSAAASLRF